jgi:hypothetical protein
MTGTERKRAWRERQKTTAVIPRVTPGVTPGSAANKIAVENHAQASVRASVAGMASPRLGLLDCQRDTLKVLLAEVRLKHSLAADAEQRAVRATVTKIGTHLLLRGIFPTLDIVRPILAGGPVPK